MKSAYNKTYFIQACVQLVDMISINVCYFVYLFMDEWLNYDPIFFNAPKRYWLLMNVAYLIAINCITITLHRRASNPETVLHNVLRTIVLFIVIFVALIGMSKLPTPGYWKCILLGVPTFVYISSVRLLARRYIKHKRSLGRDTIPVIIVGYGRAVQNVINTMNDKWNGFNLLGVFDDTYFDENEAHTKRLGGVEDALTFIKEYHVDEVFIGLSSTQDSRIEDFIEECELQVIRLYYVPSSRSSKDRKTFAKPFGDGFILATHREPLLRLWPRFEKRTFDIVFSGLFLCTIYPFIYFIVALITKLTNPGPVYFKQERTGYDGTTFKCIKFRSMRVNKDADRVQASKDDPRITRWGHFLRHSNIDELPQFINVFKGEMSVVGPRPHMLAHTEYYSTLIPHYMIRHLVRPGVTGWAQTHGERGETKTVDDMARRVKLDIRYLENWSFWLDITIIIRTITNIFRGDEKAC